MNKPIFKWIFAGAFFCVLYPLGVHANIDAPKIDPNKKAPSAAPLSDKKILTHLYLENLRQTEADRIAQDKNISQETRDMAEDFQKDHIFFAKEIRALAGRLGIKLRKVPLSNSIEGKKTIRQRAQLGKLKVLDGPAFEKRYKDVVLRDHQETIDFIQTQQALLPKDSPVFNLLGDLLPKLHDHYDQMASTPTLTTP